MAERKEIVCKCGRLLGTTSSQSGAGTKICPSCKKKVRYDITPNKVYTSYVK